MSYPIGILDYGIGGMGLTKVLQEKYPELPLFYFSDSGFVPYGKLNKIQLRSRIEDVLSFMFNQGCIHIVVACHSASSVIIPSQRNVTTITDATLESVRKSGLSNVAIIGGGRTIRSGVYRKKLISQGILVHQRIAQELSILIERGEVSGPYVESVLKSILTPIKNSPGLLLACTHYPVLSDTIRKYMNPQVLLVDPIHEVFSQLLRSKILTNSSGKSSFLTSGDSALMSRASKAAFQLQIPKPLSVTLDLKKQD